MSAEDIYARLKAGVVQSIKELELEGGGLAHDIGDKVYSLMSPGNRTGIKSYPAVIVTTFGQVESRHSATNMSENWWRPVAVFIVTNEGAGVVTIEEKILTWRTAIMRLFQQPVRDLPDALRSAVPELCDCVVEPAAIFDGNMQEYQGVASSLVVKPLTTERRKGR